MCGVEKLRATTTLAMRFFQEILGLKTENPVVYINIPGSTEFRVGPTKSIVNRQSDYWQCHLGNCRTFDQVWMEGCGYHDFYRLSEASTYAAKGNIYHDDTLKGV